MILIEQAPLYQEVEALPASRSVALSKDYCEGLQTMKRWCLDSIASAPTKELIMCRDCAAWDTEHSAGKKPLGNYRCICQEWSYLEEGISCYTAENEWCSRAEPKE